MTNQEKKERLQKYRAALREAARLEQEIQRWRSQAEKMTPVIHMTPSGGAGGRSLESAVERIDELARQLGERKSEAVRLRVQIGDAIDSVPDAKLQELLRLRYIEGFTWERIAVEMDISYQWVCQLHGRALSEIFLGS